MSLQVKPLLPNGRKRPIIQEFHTQIQQDTTQQRAQPPFTDPLLKNRRQPSTANRREKNHVRHVRVGSRRAIMTLDFPVTFCLSDSECEKVSFIKAAGEVSPRDPPLS